MNAYSDLPAILHEPVERWFERWREAWPDAVLPAGSDAAVARLLASSEFAATVLLREWPWFTASYETLSAVQTRRALDDFVAEISSTEAPVDEIKRRIRRFRQRWMVQTLWREVCAEASLDETLFALSDLADCLLRAATAIAERQMLERYGVVRNEAGDSVSIVILGMGKLGGRELNFSSDIDLIFLYPDGGDSDGRKSISPQEYFTRVSRHIIALLDDVTADGFAFRIDTRLRPFGDSGPPVVNFAALESYLLQHGRDWERYAYVKARIVGPQPPADVQKDLYEGLICPFVYRRYIDFGVFESLRDMHAMIAAQVRRKELADNVKLGPGGIREIEFIVQSLQLVRGGNETELQARELQPTVQRLVATRGLDRETAADLLSAYAFLRRLENFIQAMRDQQTHDLPGDPQDRARLCVAMRYEDWAVLAADFDAHRRTVNAHFNEIAMRGRDADTAQQTDVADIGELLDDATDTADWHDVLAQLGLPDDGALAERLRRFSGQAQVRQLDTVARQRLRAFLPRLLERIGECTHPPLALERTLAVVERVLRRSAYLSLLNENPAALARLVDLCGRSAYVAEQIARHPVLLDELLDVRAYCGEVSKAYLQTSLQQRLSRSPEADSEQQIEILARYQRASMFHIAVADFNGALPIMKVSDGLTWLAETVIEHALHMTWLDMTARHGVPVYRDDDGEHEAGFGVIAYGKLGGLELSYGSDLDLVFLHDSHGSAQLTNGDKPLDNPVFFSRLVRRLVHVLTVQSGTGELYEIDTRLRPDGRSGVLVTSTEAFERYQEDNAWTWEHQALLRARAVAGSLKVGAAFERIRRQTLMNRVRRDSLREDVIEMRRRMRKELDRSDDTQFDLKHGKGGIGDIEFLVQYLVLGSAAEQASVIEYSDNIRQLDALAAASLLDQDTAGALQQAYREYRKALHRLVLNEQRPLIANTDFAEQRACVAAVWEQHLGV